MHRLRLFIRAYFGFSRMETNAFLLFIPLIFVLLFSGSIYRRFVWSEPFPDPRRTDSLLAWLESHQIKRDTIQPSVAFHPFDPNRVSEGELIALQLKPWIAKRIVGYRSKGGSFRKAEDVLRIYGMDSAWYATAKQWMRFTVPLSPPKGKTVSRQKSTALQDINTADTTGLMDVYGIGRVLAKRIVTFRDRLGGFVDIGQLKEVYGLDSAVIGRLKKRFSVMPEFKPRQLPINTAMFEELSSHPYIGKRRAQTIEAFIKQHGKLDSLGQLGQIRSLDAAWLAKVKPYLTLENQ